MRIWNLRLNLDELNALNRTGMTEAIRSDLWIGLVYGCNGLDLPEGASKHLRATFELGSAWRQEAEAHSERMSQGGKSSVESRKAKHGTAQPPKVVRTSLELPSEGSPNQSTIYNLQSTNNNPKTEKASSPSRARSVKKEEIPPLPEELLSFLETLTRDWPRKSHDGRRVTILRPKDTWDKICKNRGDDDPKIPVNAALAYLDTNPTSYVIGMDNFFGKDRKYTKYVVED